MVKAHHHGTTLTGDINSARLSVHRPPHHDLLRILTATAAIPRCDVADQKQPVCCQDRSCLFVFFSVVEVMKLFYSTLAEVYMYKRAPSCVTVMTSRFLKALLCNREKKKPGSGWGGGGVSIF